MRRRAALRASGSLRGRFNPFRRGKKGVTPAAKFSARREVAMEGRGELGLGRENIGAKRLGQPSAAISPPSGRPPPRAVMRRLLDGPMTISATIGQAGNRGASRSSPFRLVGSSVLPGVASGAIWERLKVQVDVGV